MTALVAARGLSCGYDSVAVVRDLDLTVEPGEVVALLGPNGAGKTTTLLTLSGALPALAGEVLWKGTTTTAPLYRRARHGLAFVTEERSVFMRLSARDNLRAGRVAPRDAIALFPELAPRLDLQAGLLSGGEQQMLTLARALARRPEMLLVDELSMGLAPLVVQRLLRAVRDAANRGVGVLVVEQHIHMALEVADRAYVMRRGRIELAGTAAELVDQAVTIEAAYLTSPEATVPESGSLEQGEFAP
jgi:branched-chain amino acid transport system ATP-binding protein